MAIECNINNPDVFHVEDAGRVEYMEFENDIWIMDIFALKRGTGLKLARAFIKYARKAGKNIYGQANPQKHDTMMDIDRLVRFYESLGAKRIRMECHPFAMKLEITNG